MAAGVAVRIVLTSPFAHPHVRRGAERYLDDLSRWLGGRGHDVTVVTTAREPTPTVTTAEGVEIRYRRRGRSFGRPPVEVDDELRSLLPVARGVRHLDVDVAQCHHSADAVGLRLARLARPVPYVLWLPGTARGGTFRRRPFPRMIFRSAVRGAARIHALSRYAADTFREFLALEPEVMPPGVSTDWLAGPKPVSGEPTILCTAAPDDPRKRVGLLVRAFAGLSNHHPDVRLVLVPPRREGIDAMLAGLDEHVRARVEVREDLDSEDLAAAYRAASVTVLPSIREAFGLVLVESLAAGTPAVGSDHGAIPEVVTDPAIGRLFAPDDAEALTRALLEALEISTDPATPERCRRHAEQWDWSVLGPRHEAVYEQLAG